MIKLWNHGDAPWRQHYLWIIKLDSLMDPSRNQLVMIHVSSNPGLGTTTSLCLGSWILYPNISASIIFSDSATEIWLDLNDHFQQNNEPRIFQLRRELTNLVQNQNSVSVHFTNLKTLSEELRKYRPSYTCRQCACGGVREPSSYFQMEYVMSFLIGLNDSYAQIRSQLLMLDHIPQI